MFRDSPAPPADRAFAPAKINLYLHVAPARPDGYHPICSLMVFADIGDSVTIAPAEAMSLDVDGPFAGGAPATDNNLVLRAARLLAPEGAWRFGLDKQTPVGAGLGGGSADAAAAMRLVAARLPGKMAQSELEMRAALIGSDVPACIRSAPVLAQGRGEELQPGPQIPRTPAVLVYPDAPVSTAAVYRAFDAHAPQTTSDPPTVLADCATRADVAALVRASRNDLEQVAIGLQPVVSDVLGLLRTSPYALAARMSGSGSACFAICATDSAAEALAGRIAAAQSSWWVRACHIGGRPL